MQEKPKSRRRWGWRTCLGVGLLLGAICCGLPTALAWWGLERTFGVRHELGWIDSERKKLPPWEPLPVPNPNAFDTYRSAMALLPTGEIPETVYDWGTAVMRADAEEASALLPEARSYLDQCGPAFAKMHEAAGQDYLAPEGIEPRSSLAVHSGQRRLARLGVTAARLSLQSGDDRAALSTLEDVYALGVHIPHGGDFVEMSTGGAVVSIAQRHSTDILLSGRITPHALRAHAARMRALRGRVWPLADTVHKAAMHTLGAFDRTFRRGVSPADFEPRLPGDVTPPSLENRVRGHFMTADVWRSREWVEDRYARLAEELRKPIDESRFREIADRTEADAKARNDTLAEMVVPMPAWERDRWAQTVTYLAADEAIACLEAYKKERGVYPESLAALVPDYMPDLPEDPWTGTPLIYRLTPERYTLYATGPNCVDDGGVSEGRPSLEPDFVIVPIPPPRQASTPAGGA
jgi:hypothetical protein